MRQVKENNLILEQLKQIRRQTKSVTLWQNPHNKRILNHSNILKIKETESLLELGSLAKPFRFSSLYPIYIYTPFKTTVLKTRILFNSTFKLVLEMPIMLYAEEMRKIDRLSLKGHSSRFSAYFHKDDKLTNGKLYFQSKILDFSSKGAALRVSHHQIHKFETGDQVGLRKIGKDVQDQILLGKVNYTHKMQMQTIAGEFHRVGIIFNEEFDLTDLNLNQKLPYL
jgi:hypothetical protein